MTKSFKSNSSIVAILDIVIWPNKNYQMTWCPKISAWCVNMKHYTDDHHGDRIFDVTPLNLYNI